MENSAIFVLGVLAVIVLARRFRVAPRGRGRRKGARRMSAPRRSPSVVRFPARPPLDGSVLRGRARVVDGDTLVIRKVRIRLFGIDAPELNHPHGKTAKWALIRLCKGQEVQADVVQVDAHGRAVARCSLPDGRDLSAEMVKAGLAIDWPKFSAGAYRAMEVPDARRKMWLADARQKGRMHVWTRFEENRVRDEVRD